MMDINDSTVLDPQLRSGGGSGPTNNFDAIVDPTTADKAPTYTNGSRWINTVTDTHWVLVDEVNGIWKETTQDSASANIESIAVPFSYNASSPLTLTTVKNGDILKVTEIKITDPSDDPNSTLEIGTFADIDSIFPASFSKFSRELQYESDSNIEFTANETVILTITPGTSTKGSGIAYLEIERS